MEAKKVELEKLKRFGVYQEVDDEGQERIFTIWVLWNKDGVKFVPELWQEDMKQAKNLVKTLPL